MDVNQLSVSGLSSGAFFAVQFHVAFSKTIMGAGIVAGGLGKVYLLFTAYIKACILLVLVRTNYIQVQESKHY